VLHVDYIFRYPLIQPSPDFLRRSRITKRVVRCDDVLLLILHAVIVLRAEYISYWVKFTFCHQVSIIRSYKIFRLFYHITAGRRATFGSSLPSPDSLFRIPKRKTHAFHRRQLPLPKRPLEILCQSLGNLIIRHRFGLSVPVHEFCPYLLGQFGVYISPVLGRFCMTTPHIDLTVLCISHRLLSVCHLTPTPFLLPLFVLPC